MNTFLIESEGPSIRLRLHGDLTIEHARELHAALAAVLRPDRALTIDASAATRMDSPILQVLVAAAGAASHAVLLAASPAWDEAFRRYALTNPFGSPTP